MDKMKIASLPINSTSFGNISIGFLYELFLRKDNSFILFDIGNPDLRVFDKLNNNDEFIGFINNLRANPLERFSRKMSHFRLWHVNGSENLPSNKNTLFTFYELDSPTKSEINILQNFDNVIVSSDYTKEILNDYLDVPIHVVPLFFDDLHYSINNERSKIPSDVCVWNIGPIKWERRKWTEKVIRTWVKKFAGNSQHILNIACYNPFVNPEGNNAFLANCLNNNKPHNVNIQGYMESLLQCNNYLNFCDIYLEGAGAEGWSLPSFTALCLGKHGLIHDCTGMKMWANKENSVLIESESKESSIDNIFFHPNQPFNQGNIFSWNEDKWIEGMEKVYERWKKNKINEEGVKLREKFTRKKFVDFILNII
jgi:hypothetical protein